MDNINNNLRICSICKDALNENESINELPCNKKHAFHPNCINKWIQEKTIELATCPTCRTKILNEVVIHNPPTTNNNNNNAYGPINEINHHQQYDLLLLLLFKLLVYFCVLIGPICIIIAVSTDNRDLLGVATIFTAIVDGFVLIMLLFYYCFRRCRPYMI